MKLIRSGLLVPLALLCLACTPLANNAPLTTLPHVAERDSRVILGELDNGLRYRLVPTAQQPGRLDIRLKVDAGSIDESDEEVGVAHLLEHQVFYNRDADGNTVRQRLLAAGWQQGRQFNALTNPERTLYMLSPPEGSGQTQLALQALAQLVLQRNFTDQDIQHERPIVIEEWRGGLGVAQRMNDQRRDSQRVGSRYVGHPPIGSLPAIRRATAAQLSAFHSRWYRPNNMQINVVGDFDPAAMKAEIDTVFGRHAAGSLPERRLDLPLMPGLKTFRLQDSESGSRRVTLMYRGHYAANRSDTISGQRERLLDRLTVGMMLDQLQRQSRPEGVKAFALQRTEIGPRSEILVVSASLEQSVHAQALQSLMREIRRMRTFGLYQTDLDAKREKLRDVAHAMLDRGDDRDFSDWVKLLNDPSHSDRVLQRRSTIAANSLHLLDSITLDEINARLVRWTDAHDLLLQLSQPTGELALPDDDLYRHWQTSIAKEGLDAPVKPKAQVAEQTEIPILPTAARRGTITHTEQYPGTGVQYWTLENGDRLVWLKHADPDGKAYLQIETDSGYGRPDRQPWLEQMASQIAWDAPPTGFSDAQWQAWQNQEKLFINLDQQATRTLYKAEFDQSRLAEVLALYRVRTGTAAIPADALQATAQELTRQLERKRPTVSQLQREKLAELRYGHQPSGLPDASALARLDIATVQRAWAEQTAAPVTYYLLADVDEAALREQVSRELAGIVRAPVPNEKPLLQQPGRRHLQLDIAIEPRATLELLSFEEQQWTPEAAVRVASLSRFAADALKSRLRGDARGLYQLTFDSDLNASTGRLETRLRFSCDPQRVDELWKQAMAVLQGLPEQIEPPQAERMRTAFEESERERLQDSATQLHRLILSDRRWGDPRYLKSQHALPQALELQALRTTAAQLVSEHNQARLIVYPRHEASR